MRNMGSGKGAGKRIEACETTVFNDHTGKNRRAEVGIHRKVRVIPRGRIGLVGPYT